VVNYRRLQATVVHIDPAVDPDVYRFARCSAGPSAGDRLTDFLELACVLAGGLEPEEAAELLHTLTEPVAELLRRGLLVEAK
jgi:hypothetical protein